MIGTIRRRRYSAIRQAIIAFAWISVFASTCSMAFLPEGQPQETAAPGQVHDHSHDDAANPKYPQDCCCDHPDYIKVDPQKPFEFTLLAAFLPGQDPVELIRLHTPQKYGRILPVHITSPPVYLSTLRLRF